MKLLVPAQQLQAAAGKGSVDTVSILRTEQLRKSGSCTGRGKEQSAQVDSGVHPPIS